MPATRSTSFAPGDEQPSDSCHPGGGAARRRPPPRWFWSSHKPTPGRGALIRWLPNSATQRLNPRGPGSPRCTLRAGRATAPPACLRELHPPDGARLHSRSDLQPQRRTTEMQTRGHLLRAEAPARQLPVFRAGAPSSSLQPALIARPGRPFGRPLARRPPTIARSMSRTRHPSTQQRGPRRRSRLPSPPVCAPRPEPRQLLR